MAISNRFDGMCGLKLRWRSVLLPFETLREWRWKRKSSERLNVALKCKKKKQCRSLQGILGHFYPRYQRFFLTRGGRDYLTSLRGAEGRQHERRSREKWLLAPRGFIHTAKKGGFYLVENARWIYAKSGICLHFLVFTDRKIQGFPIVLLSVNLSIRSIIRYFPITVNPRKRLFSGIYRSVNTWRMSCLPVFTDVKLHVHPGFTIENRLFPLFSKTENAVKFRKTHCLPEFTSRLTYGKHGVFPRSQKFSPVFLYFPRMSNSREF